jgi:hypothetical protein
MATGNVRPFDGRRDTNWDAYRSCEASVRGRNGQGPQYENATFACTADLANNYDNYYACDATSAAIVVQLPAATSCFLGTRIRAAKVDTGSNAVTFSTSYTGGDSTPIGSASGGTTLGNTSAGTSKTVVLANLNGTLVWIEE